MKLKCDNCRLIFDEDEFTPQYQVYDNTQDPPEACCPGCGAVFEGEEIEPKLRCNFCQSLISMNAIIWRKPFTVTPEDPEPHCPDCGRSEGFEEDYDE